MWELIEAILQMIEVAAEVRTSERIKRAETPSHIQPAAATPTDGDLPEHERTAHPADSPSRGLVRRKDGQSRSRRRVVVRMD